MKVDFKLVKHGSSEWKKAVTLREDILRKPLGSYFTPEELKEEEKHYHVAGLIGNQLIATAVLVPEEGNMKMQRVAVSETHRNTNIGSKMMSFCEDFSQNKGFSRIYCHARDTAVNFYLKNQYTITGDYFEEDGIPHVNMFKII